MVPLGLYLIRGDNVAVVSDIRKGVWEEQEQSGFEGFESGEGVKPLFQATFWFDSFVLCWYDVYAYAYAYACGLWYVLCSIDYTVAIG